MLEEVDLELPGSDRFMPESKYKDCLKNLPSCLESGTKSDADKDKEKKKLLDYLEKYCKDIGRGHLYGWTARYNVIYPTLNSTGAQDYVNIEDLRDMNRRGGHINCHVPLKKDHGFTVGNTPKSMAHMPSVAPYFLELMCKIQYSIHLLFHSKSVAGI